MSFRVDPSQLEENVRDKRSFVLLILLGLKHVSCYVLFHQTTAPSYKYNYKYYKKDISVPLYVCL